MKNDERKITSIGSYQLPDTTEEDKLFEKKFRKQMIQEAKEIEWKLNQKPELDDIGDESDLFDKIVGTLREQGKWEEDEDTGTELESEKPELEKSEPEKPEPENPYDFLSEEDRKALALGRKAVGVKKWIYKRSRRLKAGAAVIVVCSALVTAGLSSEANRERFLKVWTTVTDSGQSIHVSKTDERNIKAAQEKIDAAEIEKTTGIKVLNFEYFPTEFKYDCCELSEKAQNATMYYKADDGKIFYVYMIAPQLYSEQGISVDGEILEEKKVYCSNLDTSIEVQKLEAGEGEYTCKAHFMYENALYVVVGNMDQTEFEKIIKKIYKKA